MCPPLLLYGPPGKRELQWSEARNTSSPCLGPGAWLAVTSSWRAPVRVLLLKNGIVKSMPDVFGAWMINQILTSSPLGVEVQSNGLLARLLVSRASGRRVAVAERAARLSFI